MSLFGKKNEENKGCGTCGCSCNAKPTEDAKKPQTTGGSVKVLGSGCAKCNELEANTKAALETLGMDTTILHVKDFSQIAAYGVMSTPALVVDEKVVSFGKVLKTDEIVNILQKVR